MEENRSSLEGKKKHRGKKGELCVITNEKNRRMQQTPAWAPPLCAKQYTVSDSVKESVWSGTVKEERRLTRVRRLRSGFERITGNFASLEGKSDGEGLGGGKGRAVYTRKASTERQRGRRGRTVVLRLGKGKEWKGRDLREGTEKRRAGR